MIAPNLKIFVACGVLLSSCVLLSKWDPRLFENEQGFSPEQPIKYSHRLHAGDMAIDCRYCHFGSERGAVAGVPPLSVCMNCHRQVTASAAELNAERVLALSEKRKPRRVFSAEIRKIYDALGLDDNANPIPSAPRPGVAWVRVHDLPDHVRFDHRVHVARGVECQSCHGQVEAMERVRQQEDLSMGWCIGCHRLNPREGIGALLPGEGHPRLQNHVSTDCSVCHY